MSQGKQKLPVIKPAVYVCVPASLDPLIGLQLAESVVVRHGCIGGHPYCGSDGLSGTQVSTSETSECRLPLM
jgi:hypothetical protein